ncbi:hypothetical protein ACO0QE_002568 [Hanseniaspora vineae]
MVDMEPPIKNSASSSSPSSSSPPSSSSSSSSQQQQQQKNHEPMCVPAEFEFVGDRLLEDEMGKMNYDLPINVVVKDYNDVEESNERDEQNGHTKNSHWQPSWITLFQSKNINNDSSVQLPFDKDHFIQAMTNVIKHPNINSTIILRADLLVEIEPSRAKKENKDLIATDFSNDSMINYITTNIQDTTFRDINLHNSMDDLNGKWHLLKGYVRRIIPRNPSKDAIINQSCLVLENENKKDVLIIYTPHIQNQDQCPFYIPKVASVGILFQPNSLSVHYIPFAETSSTDSPELSIFTDQQQRIVRTALRLLQTAYKHSKGCKNGYSPKVKHDLIVDKVKFQKKYLELKQKYGSYLVENWMESTDPKKHAFEEIAIAAFLLELWDLKYKGKYLAQNSDFEFRDLGCGNGILTYILIMEGCKGVGIDARTRKTWQMFPEKVQQSLKQQVIIPSILLRPNIQMKYLNPNLTDNNMVFQIPAHNDLISDKATILYTSKDLIESKHINIAEFTTTDAASFENIFVIGNHSDELTCWIPLLGYPFMVIPCCSHNFSGAKHRFRQKQSSLKSNNNKKDSNSLSTYGALVEKVIDVSKQAGWNPVEKEMLRIPSTRNAAVIGIHNTNYGGKLNRLNWPNETVYDIIMEDGGANGWIENSMKLMTKK